MFSQQSNLYSNALANFDPFNAEICKVDSSSY